MSDRLPGSSLYNPIRYKDKWSIWLDNPIAEHPDGWRVAWAYVHDDYDGEGDPRCGNCDSPEACMREIDGA